MKNALTKAYTALKSIAVGLGITGRTLTQPWDTVLYPMAGVDNLDTYRGHIELVGGEADPSRPRCIGCGQCMDLCPSGCITVDCAVAAAELKANDFLRAEAHMGVLAPKPSFEVMVGNREPKFFHLDYSMCSLCGQCVRGCPAGALRFSTHAIFTARDRADFRLDLKARLAEQARAAESPARAAQAGGR